MLTVSLSTAAAPWMPLLFAAHRKHPDGRWPTARRQALDWREAPLIVLPTRQRIFSEDLAVSSGCRWRSVWPADRLRRCVRSWHVGWTFRLEMRIVSRLIGDLLPAAAPKKMPKAVQTWLRRLSAERELFVVLHVNKVLDEFDGAGLDRSDDRPGLLIAVLARKHQHAIQRLVVFERRSLSSSSRRLSSATTMKSSYFSAVCRSLSGFPRSTCRSPYLATSVASTAGRAGRRRPNSTDTLLRMSARQHIDERSWSNQRPCSSADN